MSRDNIHVCNICHYMKGDCIDMDRQKLMDLVSQKVDENRNAYVDFLKQVVSRDSRIFDHGAKGCEDNAQAVIKQFLSVRGAEVDAFEPDYALMNSCPEVNPNHDYTGRHDVVGTFRGQGGGKSLIFNGHIDTVDFVDEKLWEQGPLNPFERDGKLYGRGACDMKGGLCASLLAMQTLQELGVHLRGDVIYESVIDEEGGGNGTLACITRGYKADAAIIPEPSDLWIAPAHMGWLIYRIEVEGMAIHSGAKKDGVNAIEKMQKYIEAMQEAERVWSLTRRHPYLPPQHLSINTIHGGTTSTILPNLCTLEVIVNTIPCDEPGYKWPGEKFDIEFRELMRRVTISDPWLEKHPPRITLVQLGSACDTGVSHPICGSLSQATEAVLGKKPKHKGLISGADGRLLVNYGDTPTVHFGPGSMEVAHTVNEYLPLDEFLNCIKIFAMTMADWCGIA